MQYFEGKLYVATTDSALGCIDVSPKAIKAAREGNVPKAVVLNAPKNKRAAISAGKKLDATTADKGVVVECYKEGGQLRVRPISSGYKKSWHVQFPKDLRKNGARFVVEELKVATQGGFYRAHGKISRLKE